MAMSVIFVLAVIAAGAVFAFRRRKTNRSHGGWIGLGILVVILAGLLFAEKTRNESLVWVFGLSLVVALFVMLLLAAGTAVGSLFRKRNGRDTDE